MAKAENGNTVKIHYTGTLDDGTVFDSSADREPLEFKLGDGRVIPGFEKSVLGMELNEKKDINIPIEEAYGERRDELVFNVNKTELPPDLDPQVGMQLQMQSQDGQTALVLVTGIEDESITLDANHPLAGKSLNFNIELVEIVA